MFKPVRTDLLTLCLCITLVNNYYSLANPGSSSSSSRQQVLEELHVNISRSISTVQAILSQKQNQSELCQEQSNSQYRNLTLDRSGNNNESVDYSIKLFHDCSELYEAGYAESGIFPIWLKEAFRSAFVHCDMTTANSVSSQKGWITIQRRIRGDVNFERGWGDYVRGFGTFDGDFWVGLEFIHELINQRKTTSGKETTYLRPTLRVDLEDWDGARAFAEYERFEIASAGEKYAVLGNLQSRGNAGNLVRGQTSSGPVPFSTFDADHDFDTNVNLARSGRGGWWFSSGSANLLNGPYPSGRQDTSEQVMKWGGWTTGNRNNAPLRYVTMKLQYPSA